MTQPTARASAPVLSGVRLVVFDLDGTLVDSFEDIAAAVNQVLRANARPTLTVDEVKRHVGRGARLLVAGVLAIDDPDDIERNYEILSDYYREHPARHARVYDGVVETLQALRDRNLTLAVVSNKPHELTLRVLAELGLAPYFDHMRGESPAYARKPAPDALRQLMEDAGAAPASTLVVGDSHVDVDFARAAGARVVGVTYGQHSETEIRGFSPDAVIADMRELPALIGPPG